MELARNWPRDREILPVIVDGDGEMHIIPSTIFSLMEAFFACDRKDRLALLAEEIRAFRDRKLARVDRVDIAGCAGIFLPETTYNENQIKFYMGIVGDFPEKIFAMTYDFISWLSPEHFPHFNSSQYGVTGYLRLLRRIRNLGFLSNHTKTVFETRILRGAVANPIVLGGGASAFEGTDNRPDSACPEFVFIGTVQLRKQHFLVLDVFSKLWASGCTARLTFVGQAGNIGDAEAERLRKLSASQPLFSWIKNASDGDIRNILGRATALLYPSMEEGLGLPFLEGLRVGIPAIVSQTLPALEFAAGGYVAIDVNAETLDGAVRSFLDPVFADARRREIDRDALPSWDGIARKVADWIRAGEGAAGGAGVPEHPLEIAGIPAIGFIERFRRAGIVHRLDRHDGIAFIEACFEELFGRSPAQAEVTAWSGVLESQCPSKLDLLLLMASSDDGIARHGVADLRSWVLGLSLYRSCPDLSYNAGYP
ncbi:hypothetical protein TSH100_08235 [Azospirillum sp. TSH100]|nr:hypothetical protein TSH100_08235 [Azospirillum sp. TSH100]